MDWTSARSTCGDLDTAWADVRAELQQRLQGELRFLMIFVVGHPASVGHRLVQYAKASFPHAQIAGGLVGGLMVDGAICQDGPMMMALAMSSASLVRAEVVALPAGMSALRECLRAQPWSNVHGAVAMLDPMSVDVEDFDAGLRACERHVPVGGGVIMPDRLSGRVVLWTQEGPLEDGGVLILLHGGTVTVEVEQGVRPISHPYIVMRKRGNIIDELDDGQPARALLQALEQADVHENALENVVAGIDMNANALSTAPREYVMRALIGADLERGTLAVDARLEQYQSLRFFLRDPALATQEVHERLRRWCPQSQHSERTAPTGGQCAMFACISMQRDDEFWGKYRSDAGQLDQICGDAIPYVGLMCMEEFVTSEHHAAFHQVSAVFCMLERMV